MPLSVTQKAVLRIIIPSVFLYSNFKFFFSKDGPGPSFAKTFCLALLLAAYFGIRAGRKTFYT